MYARLAMAGAAFCFASASLAEAAWVPGSEIIGQQVQVQTAGVTNTIYFNGNGTATIMSPSGAKSADAVWTANDGELCLTSSYGTDCYPYLEPFQAGKPVDLMSKCAVLTRWLAPAITVPAGERG